MPVSGYYEWQATPDGKQPRYFTVRDGSPVLTVAALWDEWKDRANTDKPVRSCTMIITEPNDFVAQVHDGCRPCYGQINSTIGWVAR
jgi:putative SOS response-associated peptidase YedK